MERSGLQVKVNSLKAELEDKIIKEQMPEDFSFDQPFEDPESSFVDKAAAQTKDVSEPQQKKKRDD